MPTTSHSDGLAVAKRRGRWLPIVAAGVATLIAATLAALWLVSRDDQGTQSPARTGLACGFDVVPGSITPECEAARQDLLRRRAISAEQRAAAEPASIAIRHTATGQTQTSCAASAGVGSGCPTVWQHPPRQSDVDALRGELARQQFRDTVVRLARRGDPAPEGSLMWAVKVGDVCVNGYVSSVPGGLYGQQIVGPLPDGSCMTR